jgi:hypothetical protein
MPMSNGARHRAEPGIHAPVGVAGLCAGKGKAGRAANLPAADGENLDAAACHALGLPGAWANFGEFSSGWIERLFHSLQEQWSRRRRSNRWMLLRAAAALEKAVYFRAAWRIEL